MCYRTQASYSRQSWTSYNLSSAGTELVMPEHWCYLQILTCSSVGTWLFLMLLVHSGIQLFRLHFFVTVYMHILFCVCISMCFSTLQAKTACINEYYLCECKITRAYPHQLVLEIKSEGMEERVWRVWLLLSAYEHLFLPIYGQGILLLISTKLQMPKTCKHSIQARFLLMQVIFLTVNYQRVVTVQNYVT